MQNFTSSKQMFNFEHQTKVEYYHVDKCKKYWLDKNPHFHKKRLKIILANCHHRVGQLQCQSFDMNKFWQSSITYFNFILISKTKKIVLILHIFICQGMLHCCKRICNVNFIQVKISSPIENFSNTKNLHS